MELMRVMYVCVCVFGCAVKELNVRVVTVTADKHKYGIMLRAEPDHKVPNDTIRYEMLF